MRKTTCGQLVLRLVSVCLLLVTGLSLAPLNALAATAQTKALYEEAAARQQTDDLFAQYRLQAAEGKSNFIIEALKWLGGKALDKIGAESMNAAWNAIFGDSGEGAQILAQLAAIQNQLGIMKDMLNRILEEIQVQKYTGPIQAHNKTMTDVLSATAMMMEQYDGCETPLEKWATLDTWATTPIAGYANPFLCYRSIVDQMCTSQVEAGTIFQVYAAYGSVRFNWERQSAGFQTAQRERDMYILAQLGTMNALYIQYKRGLDNPTPTEGETGEAALDPEVRNFIKVMQDSTAKILGAHEKTPITLTPKFNTFHFQGKSYAVWMTSEIKRGADIQFKFGYHLQPDKDLRELRKWLTLPGTAYLFTHALTSDEYEVMMEAARTKNMSVRQMLQDGDIEIPGAASANYIMLSRNPETGEVLEIGDWHGPPTRFWRDCWIRTARLDENKWGPSHNAFRAKVQPADMGVSYDLTNLGASGRYGPISDSNDNTAYFEQNDFLFLEVRHTTGIPNTPPEPRPDSDAANADPARYAENLLRGRYQQTGTEDDDNLYDEPGVVGRAADALCARYAIQPNAEQRASIEALVRTAYRQVTLSVAGPEPAAGQDPPQEVYVTYSPLAAFTDLVVPPAPAPGPLPGPIPDPSPDPVPGPLPDPAPGPVPAPDPVPDGTAALHGLFAEDPAGDGAGPNGTDGDYVDRFIAACRAALDLGQTAARQTRTLRFSIDEAHQRLVFDKEDIFAIDLSVLGL